MEEDWLAVELDEAALSDAPFAPASARRAPAFGPSWPLDSLYLGILVALQLQFPLPLDPLASFTDASPELEDASLAEFDEESLPELEDESLPELEDESLAALEDESLPELEDESLAAFDEESLPELDDWLAEFDDDWLSELDEGSLAALDEDSLPELDDGWLAEFDDESLPEFDDDSLPALDDASLPELDEEPLPALDDDWLPELDDESLPELDEDSLPALDDDSLPELDDESLPELDDEELPDDDEELPEDDDAPLPELDDDDDELDEELDEPSKLPIPDPYGPLSNAEQSGNNCANPITTPGPTAPKNCPVTPLSAQRSICTSFPYPVLSGCASVWSQYFGSVHWSLIFTTTLVPTESPLEGNQSLCGVMCQHWPQPLPTPETMLAALQSTVLSPRFVQPA